MYIKVTVYIIVLSHSDIEELVMKPLKNVKWGLNNSKKENMWDQ